MKARYNRYDKSDILVRSANTIDELLSQGEFIDSRSLMLVNDIYIIDHTANHRLKYVGYILNTCERKFI
jgi:hypothetical protein